ncbi:MAG: outer membrane beta-barrel protein [Gemmatimonadaceae bacterium]
MKSILIVIAVMMASASTADAQLFYVGVRAGAAVPTGDFAGTSSATGDNALLTGATPGLAYGLDGGVGLGLIGFYGAYEKIQFGCKSGACPRTGEAELTGVSAGVRVRAILLPLFKPWVKAGVTYNEMKVTFPNSPGRVAYTTNKTPGLEAAAGIDIPVLGGFFNLTPQVRYVRQKMEPRTSSTISLSKRSADYYTFDIGLRLRSPI